jgi:DNA-binding CsgD family transcriptional regulator
MRRRGCYAENKEAFLALCRDGTPRDHIAARLGLTVDQVKHQHAYLRGRGECPYPLARAAERNVVRSILTGREDEIRRLFALGLGRMRIARQLGVTNNTLAGFVHRKGLRPENRKRARDINGRVTTLKGHTVTLPPLAARPVRDWAICDADIKAGAALAKAMERA